MTRPAAKKIPCLIGLSGPAKDKQVDIDGLVGLGRDAGNTVRLDDETVSRTHTQIAIRGEQVLVRDLGSTNGTYVNGARLAKGGERVLKHRDILKIGNSRFVYLQHEEPELKTTALERDANRERRTTTIRVAPIDEFVARSDKSVGEALVRFGNVMNRIPVSDDLLLQTLEAVFDIMPAERIAIVLPGSTAVYRELKSDSNAPFDINSFIRKQALDNGIPVQSNDGDSVLCVPIVTHTSTLGMVYVQHHDESALDGRHLEMLSAITGFAAAALESLLDREWLRAQARLQDEVKLRDHAIVGESPRIKEVYLTIQKVAVTDATVLILGENGTGKELAALAIHQNSKRAGNPFVTVNCGAISEELRHSELFGHEKGSFTGATSQQKGKLEKADGGTVFLDEIGELSLSVQVSLLRYLQQHEIQRVGSNIIIPSDARLIAATNRNLEQMVRQGTFRQDLYYRLRVVPLRMPSLTERREDIPLLTSHFIKANAAKMGKSVFGVTREAHQMLMSHDWKGNVRELEHAIIGSLVFAEGDYIRAQDLWRVLEEPPPIHPMPDDSLDSFLERAERWMIQSTLDETKGNVAITAQRLKLHPGSLYRRLEKLNISHDPD